MYSQLLKDNELPVQLQDLLPSGYSYKLKKWTFLQTKEDASDQFEAVIFTNVYTEEEAQEWWHKFNTKSNTTMRVRATCPKTGKVNTFKIYLRCLHQGRVEKPEQHRTQCVKRNTNCPASMVVAIRRCIKYSRSKMRDPVDPLHPCEIQLRFIHNHPINDAESLRFRPVSKEVEEKLLALYNLGHSPISALEMLKLELKVKHGNEYFDIASDRCYCPDKGYCYRLFYKHFGKDYKAFGKKDLCNVLDNKIQHYNSEIPESCVSGMDGSDYAIAVCTPIMKRAHLLTSASDVVYVETLNSTGNKERTDHLVFLLSVHTVAGAVPLGAVLTTSTSVSNLTLAFQLLKQLLPVAEQAFCRGGSTGPQAFMIEDSENLRIALKNIWPSSNIITCTFLLLQQIWKWLWNDSHNIKDDHRLYLLYLAKTLMFSSDEATMKSKYQILCIDSISTQYPSFLQVINKLWERRHDWRICFNRLSPLQGASNYYEASSRVFKDKMLEEVRAFNTIQLLNYLITHISMAYKKKLLDLVNNKLDRVFLCHFKDSIPPDVAQRIKQVPGNYFLVPRQHEDSVLCTVDAELNVCSCPFGINGTLCIHQYWVFLSYPSETFKVLFCDNETKENLYRVAEGSHSANPSFSPSTSTKIHSSVFPTNFSKTNPNSNSQLRPMTVDTTSYYNDNASSSNDVSLTVASSLNMMQSSKVNQDVTSQTILASTNNIGVVPEINGPLKKSSAIGHWAFTNQVSNTSEPVLGLKNMNTVAVEHVNSNNTLTEIQSFNVPNSTPNSASLLTSDIPEKTCSDKEKECETEQRMAVVLEKFDKFCERVKDGLKSQPKDFLPAVEIMMKTLERKGNSTELIVSGLSFFGVLSAPSLRGQKRKRSLKLTGIASKEMIPKVYGRQMVTYGKRRLLVQNPSDKITLESTDKPVKDLPPSAAS